MHLFLQMLNMVIFMKQLTDNMAEYEDAWWDNKCRYASQLYDRYGGLLIWLDFMMVNKVHLGWLCMQIVVF